MILVINVCKEKLYYYEFVKPIEDILNKSEILFVVKSYGDAKLKDLEKTEKVIICGTSLKDFDYLKNISKFDWIKNFDKPLLGICAGMQIIGSVFGGKIKKRTEVGFYQEDFKKNFLGLEGKQEVYHLHNSFIDFKKLNGFEILAEGNGVSQAIKHKEKAVYGVLFHPEVRQKEIILNFVKK